jgi:hypothetical protein
MEPPDYKEQIQRNISLAEKRKNITYDWFIEDYLLNHLIDGLREVVPKLEPPITSEGNITEKWGHVVKFPDALEDEDGYRRDSLFPPHNPNGSKLLGLIPSNGPRMLKVYRETYCKINHAIPVHPYKIDQIIITSPIHEFTEGSAEKSRGLIIEMSKIKYDDYGRIIDDWQIASDNYATKESEDERDDEPPPPPKTVAELREEEERKEAIKALVVPEDSGKSDKLPSLLPPPPLSAQTKRGPPEIKREPSPPPDLGIVSRGKGKARMTEEEQASEQLAQRLAGNVGREDDSDDD